MSAFETVDGAAAAFREASWIAGRDATIPEAVVALAERAEQPLYDSVVIRGSGVGALTIAGRLARSRSLAGNVVLAAPRPEENRRLVNGCTLRSRSIDYYAAAFGTTREVVLRTMYGARWRDAASRSQAAALVEELPDGSFRLGRTEEWIRSDQWHDLPLVYGTRNGRLVGALLDLLEPLGVRWHGTVPPTFEECRALATGKRPLVINATHHPLAGVAERARPKRFVVAAQMTFTAPRRRSLGLVADEQALVCGRRRDGALDAGVYYPFVDPLSPAAEFYGIYYRIVRAGAFDRARETDVLRRTVAGVGRAFGLEPLDEEETLGTACVPCTSWRDDVHRHRHDFVDFEAIYGAGTPIVTGCGMSRAGLAGFVAAEAVLAGRDVVAVTNRSLRRWRLLNAIFAHGMTTLSAASEPLLRRFPGVTLRWIADYENFWAGVPQAPAARV